MGLNVKMFILTFSFYTIKPPEEVSCFFVKSNFQLKKLKKGLQHCDMILLFKILSLRVKFVS